MTEQTTGASPFVPPWSGFHHIALVTRDLDATMRFYRDALGIEIIFTAPARDLHGRHCAFRPGGDLDRLGLHFFEYPQTPLFGPEDRPLVSAVFDPGAPFLSHISLAPPEIIAYFGIFLKAIRSNQEKL